MSIFDQGAAILAGVGLWLVSVAPIPVDLVKLTTVDWRRGESLPDDIEELDGLNVSLEGYMHSTKPGVRKTFLLVPDTRCRCSGTPPPNKFVKVTLESGSTDFLPGKLKLAGKIEVGEEEEGGFVTSIYRIRARVEE